MQSLYEKFRIGAVVALVFGGTVLPVTLSRGPQLPAVQASEQQADSAASGSRLLPRIVAQADAAGMGASESASATVTVGPKTALRMHGGSVLTDFLTQ
jgi:hypothetical protein